MPANSFFALCYLNGQQVVKRLEISAAVQQSLEAAFTNQENDFRLGITEETEFTGDWNPDEGGLLYVNIQQQISLIENAIHNPLSILPLDTRNFLQEGVKAIFTGEVRNGQTVILLQKFTPKQLLDHGRFAMILSNNVLTELTSPVLTLDNKLVGIVEGDILKFKSYHNIRSLFDLTEIFRAATDEDIDELSAHACLEISDLTHFKEEVDQVARKLIHAIQKNGTLDDHTATEIQNRGSSVDIDIVIRNGKVVMPEDRAEIKRLLRFLHDDIYEAPLSGLRYVSNSKKRE